MMREWKMPEINIEWIQTDGDAMFLDAVTTVVPKAWHRNNGGVERFIGVLKERKRESNCQWGSNNGYGCDRKLCFAIVSPLVNRSVY